MSEQPTSSNQQLASTQFHEIEHTADLALWARGDTLAELFANVATGMYALSLGDDTTPIPTTVERVTIEVTGIDTETLLVNWLNELLYYTEIEGLVFSQFDILELGPGRLNSIVNGHSGVPLQKIIKAATFHGLEITATRNGYEVTIVFDV
jgi:SHS2 domain-containing protein